MSENPEEISVNARRYACAAHLTAALGVSQPFFPIIGPFIVWYLKRSDHPYIEEQARKSLNFQLSMCLYILIATLLVGALKIIFIGKLLIWVPALFHYAQVLLSMVGALRAYDMEDFNYPFTLSFIKAARTVALDDEEKESSP